MEEKYNLVTQELLLAGYLEKVRLKTFTVDSNIHRIFLAEKHFEPDAAYMCRHLTVFLIWIIWE